MPDHPLSLRPPETRSGSQITGSFHLGEGHRPFYHLSGRPAKLSLMLLKQHVCHGNLPAKGACVWLVVSGWILGFLIFSIHESHIIYQEKHICIVIYNT